MTKSSNFFRNHSTVLHSPIITDKSTKNLQTTGSNYRQYSFLVTRSSNKQIIKSEIESLFQVKVIKINTCCLPRKKKRVGKYLGWKPQYKKAMIRLAENDKINLFGDS